MQKQTKIKMNDIDSPKLGDDAPLVQTLEGLASLLLPPPPPRFPGLCTPITLLTVGSCELGTNLSTDGNRTSGSMPPDSALVLGGMTVLNPVCGRPHDGEHAPLAERHRTALHARPRSSDHLNSTASTAAAAINSTREIFPAGAPRASEDELPICNPTR